MRRFHKALLITGIFASIVPLFTLIVGTETVSHGQVGAEAISAPDIVELGEAVRGSIVDFTIDVRNTSTRDELFIPSITSSCSCTTLQDGPLTIEPGKTQQIHGEIALTNVSSREDQGVWVWVADSFSEKKTIYLRTKFVDPFPGTTSLSQDGTIVLPIDVRYRELIESVVAYPRLSDDPLTVEFSADRSSLTLRMPNDADGQPDALEVVLTLKNVKAGSSYRVAQEIEIVQENTDAYPELSQG